MFQTVFAATAATIVSGAVAERTRFSAYIVFSIAITAVIYPISGHWVWGGGWLSSLSTPFHDFAGSTVVHSVGAWVGLMGAIVIGPRLGKYAKDGKPRAIPGQNLAFGALGVFILWFGWFGFNPGSQLAAAGSENAAAISHIFVTTNLAAAAGAVTAMILTWSRYKRPGLSLTLNGALAGLVAITAGCDVVSPGGAAIIGVLAGIVLVIGVEFFDRILKIDDPVGAFSVHGTCGIWGTLAYAAYYLSFLTGGQIVDSLRFRHGYASVQAFLGDRFGAWGTRCYNFVIGVRLVSEVFANLLVIGLLFGAASSSAYAIAVIGLAALASIGLLATANAAFIIATDGTLGTGNYAYTGAGGTTASSSTTIASISRVWLSSNSAVVDCR